MDNRIHIITSNTNKYNYHISSCYIDASRPTINLIPQRYVHIPSPNYGTSAHFLCSSGQRISAVPFVFTLMQLGSLDKHTCLLSPPNPLQSTKKTMVTNTHHDGNVGNGPRTDSDIDVDIDLDMEMQSNTDFDETEFSATKSAFEQTNESLLRLQAIFLDRFRTKDGDDDNYGEDNLGDIDVPFSHTLAHAAGGGGGGNGGGSGNTNGDNNQPDVNIDIASVSPSDAPKVLRDVVRKLFGRSRSAAHAEPLKYEVLEERMSGGGQGMFGFLYGGHRVLHVPCLLSRNIVLFLINYFPFAPFNGSSQILLHLNLIPPDWKFEILSYQIRALQEF